MKDLKNKYLLILLFFVYPLLLPAQQTIEGTVRDKNSKELESAVVVLLNRESNATLAYGFSDEKGTFRLVFEPESDSLLLTVSLLGYESVKIPVSKPFPKMDISLKEKVVDLKEVKVSPKYVTLREDTISYNVSALQAQSDRKIGDVLRRIPGIEVSKSGGITYQGNPINTFYIEGLNLLDSKYGIATNNIPVDAVSSIDVIENHQPVKTLKNEILSATAAINLKLKNNKKLRPVGTVEAGGGYESDDILWLLNAFSLQVSDKRQTLLMYKTNNTGDNITEELSEQVFSSDERDRILTIPTGLLNEAGFSNPPLEESRYLLNQTHVASLNNLHKTGNDSQFRTNINYMNDARKEEINQFTSYFMKDSAFVMNEYQFTEKRANVLDGTFSYTDNSPKRFLNNSLKTKISMTDTHSDIENRIPVSRDFNLSDLYIRNNLEYIKKIGKRILRVRSFSQYFSSSHQFVAQPDTTDRIFNQDIVRKGFYTYNDSYWVNNLKAISFQIHGIAEASFDNLETDMEQFRPDSAQNRLSGNYFKFTLEPQFGYKRNGIKLSAKFPVIFYRQNINDKQYNQEDYQNLLFFNPYLNVSYAIGSETEISATSGYSNTIGNISDYMHSYIAPDYNRMFSNAGIFAESSSLRFALHLKHRDALNGFYYNLTGFYTSRKNNRISRLRFVNQMIISDYALSDNYMDTWSGIGYIAKNFYKQKINLSFSSQFMGLKSERWQQGSFYPLRNSTLILAPKISYIINRIATVSSETSIENNLLKISYPLQGNIKNKNNRISQKLNLNYFPNTQVELKIRAEYLYNEVSESVSVHQKFIDLAFIYKLKKIDLSLNFNNILNQKEYTYTRYSDLDTYKYDYKLRPRNLLLTVTFKF